MLFRAWCLPFFYYYKTRLNSAKSESINCKTKEKEHIFDRKTNRKLAGLEILPYLCNRNQKESPF